MGSTQSTWGLTSLHLCSSVLNSSSQRTRRHHNYSDIMVKFLVSIVLVLAVGALAKPQRDEGIKKTIEAQKMAAKAVEAPKPVVTEEPVVVETKIITETPVTEGKPVVSEPVVAEPVAEEKPVIAEPAVEEKPVVVEEPVVAEKPVEKTKLEGHLDCLTEAKWAPAQLLNCGKKIFHCVWCMMTQW